MNSKFLLIAFIVLFSVPSYAETVSETLISLQQDGRSFVQHRTIRSDANQYDFYVKKTITRDNFIYIDPVQYSWIEDNKEVNQLHFSAGSFSVTYTGKFSGEVSIGKDAVYTFKSGIGKIHENGHFGLWNDHENFTRLVYTWVFPQNIEIVDYQSNREGSWVQNSTSISFQIQDSNDLNFSIRYRQKDSDKDTVVDSLDLCPNTLEGATVGLNGCELDDDKDGVINRIDRCLLTVKSARVDEKGCEIDSDQDGVPDHLDHCVATRHDTMVNSKGCELDSDQDGVINRFDRCLNTRRHALVDQKGCELDFDGDGVVNSKDKCSHSAKGAKVDIVGCVLDHDKDGVVDSKDKCPVTAAGVNVDNYGCEPDTDKDGVVDVMDKCPATTTGVSVDIFGCELDADNDEVVDSKDESLKTSEMQK